ncbi:response regulator [Flammeovirgaceae bacterium SG7u.111]|nr:response regulator [Flammeovirgaceae bacterium SG7u.132]WPO36279.1 response regulator [Flammeovirgaceae bacterium SG7u.111]
MKVRSRKLFLWVVLVVGSLAASAQPAYFHHYNSSNGLSENSVFNIAQDDLGYIWLSTLNGLNRFDGYEFNTFKPEPGKEGSISSNYIGKLAKGVEGNMWIVTNTGQLNRYLAASQAFEVFPDSILPRGLQNSEGMEGLADGQLLIATDNKLIVFDPDTRSITPVYLPLPVVSVQSLANGMLCIAHKNSLAFYQWEEPLTLKKVYEVGEKVFAFNFYESECYYASRSGVHRLKSDFSSNELLFVLDELSASQVPERKVTDISYDGERYWLISRRALYSVSLEEGVFKFESHKPNANRRGAIVGELIQQLFTDALGNTWIVTLKNGVNIYNKARNRFGYYFVPQNFDEEYSDPIRAILPLKKDGYLVAFDRSGLGLMDATGQHFTPIEVYSEQIETFFRSMYRDSQGNIWVGGGAGLYLYDEEKQTLTLDEVTKRWSENIRARVLNEFEPGELVIVGAYMISLDLATKEVTLYPNLEGRQFSAFRDVEKDSEGNFWLATDQGGVVFFSETDPDNIRVYNVENGLSDNKAYCLVKLDGKMWVGTHNGLNIIDLKTKKIERLYESNGLTDNVIYGIFTDEKGYVWISTGRGLNRINSQTLEVDAYLHDFYFMDDAFTQGADGSIYFGGYTGFVSFHPKNFGQKPESPKPIIHSFKLFNQLILPGQEFEGEVMIYEPVYQLDKLSLKHTNNTFSFGFDAVPVLSPNPVRYRYKLLNYEDRWIYANPDNRQASFTNVPPGNYTLRIETSLIDSDWGAFYKEIDIVIHPPFWATLWFKLLVSAFVIGILVLLYYLRLAQIKRANQELKQQVDLQTSELKKQNEEIVRQKDEMVELAMKVHAADEAKLNVFTTVSHEFRTPLTLIMGHLEMLLTKESKNPTKSLSMVKDNAKRLLRLTNQLIEVRKIDQGKSRLHVSHFDLSKFCKELFESFEPLASKRNIRLHFLDYLKKKDVWLDPDKLEHICYNLISNAIKYSRKGGNVTLRLEEGEAEVLLNFEDDGIGISSKELPHIFDSFYRSEAGQGITGHGIGLTLVKVFAEQMQGNVKVESELENGSCFSVSFKKGKEHYPAEVLNGKRQVSAKPAKLEKAPMPSFELPSSGAKVLVVEDNFQLREYIREVLSAEFAVQEASNGAEALKIVDNESPALVVSDLMMPVMDGLTFGKKIKENPLSAHIPLILLTAKTDTETKIKGFGTGADDFIEKPFEPALLLARVKALLHNRKSVKTWAEDDLLKAADTLKIGSTDKAFLESVKNCVKENLSNPDFSIEKMGNELGMSRSTFYRKFKSLTGLSANEYLKKERLRKASALLQEGNIPVSAVCFEVGFQSQAHFRTNFKKEFGTTPSQHRAEVGVRKFG